MSEPEDSRKLRYLLRERWQINWQTISAIAKILGVLVSVVVLSYPFWPRVKIQAVPDDVSPDPLKAKFQFQYTGGIDIEGVEISCEIKLSGRKIITSGVSVKEATGIRGQMLGRIGASSPPIVRTCGVAPQIGNGAHPASIEIDVDWYYFTIGHQYFISQRAPDGRCCLMVPESDPPAQ